jgi:CubicO group peptidase (beta-lactamase class C family)
MRAIPLALAVVAALLNARAAGAQDLSRAKPEDLGFSSERLERITKIFREDAARGNAPGFVLLIARHGKLGYFEATGVLNPETKAPMTGDAIFRIYSMTKPITQVAAMLLYEEGRITLDEPIAKYLPQFKDMKVGIEKADPAGGQPTLDLVPAQRPILIHDLMRHTSGLTYGDFGDLLVKKAYNDAGLTKGDFDNAEFADRLAKLPLAFQPGTTWDYGHSTDILGRLVEVVSGKPLYRFEKERLLDPLGMQDTSFYVTDPAKQSRIVEPFKDDRTFGIDAEFNDPRVAGKWEAGGHGMVGTATDYARFLQMLLSGGALDGKRYLGPRTIAYMTADHLGHVIVPGPYYLPGPGYGFGLGFAVRMTQGVSSRMGNPGEYEWGGVGGTYFWVDPREDMFVVFMMQSPAQRTHYYALIRDMIYAALVK